MLPLKTRFHFPGRQTLLARWRKKQDSEPESGSARVGGVEPHTSQTFPFHRQFTGSESDGGIGTRSQSSDTGVWFACKSSLASADVPGHRETSL